MTLVHWAAVFALVATPGIAACAFSRLGKRTPIPWVGAAFCCSAVLLPLTFGFGMFDLWNGSNEVRCASISEEWGPLRRIVFFHLAAFPEELIKLAAAAAAALLLRWAGRKLTLLDYFKLAVAAGLGFTCAEDLNRVLSWREAERPGTDSVMLSLSLRLPLFWTHSAQSIWSISFARFALQPSWRRAGILLLMVLGACSLHGLFNSTVVTGLSAGAVSFILLLAFIFFRMTRSVLREEQSAK